MQKGPGQKPDPYFLQFHFIYYRRCFLSSAPSSALKYAGATSNTVLHPFCPSWFMRYAALAYATKTLDVNSGLESNFKLYSMICLFSFSHPVRPLSNPGR